MTTDDLSALRRLLMDGLGGRRFTQASPVLPDVWLAYAAAPDKAQELLVTPDRNGRAGVLARNLRRDLEVWREEKSRSQQERDRARIASIPDLVAARLHFDEMIAIVVPRTDWWRDQAAHLASAFPNAVQGDGPARRIEFEKAWFEAVGHLIDEATASTRSAGGSVPAEDVWRHDFLWLVAVVGLVRLGSTGDPSGAELATAFFDLFPNGLPAGSRAGPDNPWRVSLNRPVDPAESESALAIKADAARLLFNISCRKITWAILDSGIDAAHPAFRDWTDPAPLPEGEPRPSRVDRTYDFTEVRDLLDPQATSGLFEPNNDLTQDQQLLQQRLLRNLGNLGLSDPKRDGPRYVLQLQQRLDDGLEIDWSLLEPFLRDVDPPPPPTGHGTHVAGVLAADWREEEAGAPEGGQARTPPRIVMQGICPDIRLFDMRVLRAGDHVREFEVIAALQFIGHLNRRADAQLVHGANLSIETLHDVTNYACGSTPVCETCNQLWASGVVLVAAAGNRGHQRYQLASGGELGGYHPISITDPGNAEGVITVGSTHCKAHRYGVSYFSSRGPTGDGRRKPDLVAPGEQIRGPLPGGAEGLGAGTSYAAPHVSGAAALLMARFEELHRHPDKIKKIICGTATDLGREPYFQGAGMLDILRALQSI
jgi:serine protease AprX